MERKFLNILRQTNPAQQHDLFELLNNVAEFCPEGFPDYYIGKTSLQLTLKEIEFLVNEFEKIQKSDHPFLAGIDISGVNLTLFDYGHKKLWHKILILQDNKRKEKQHK